MENLRLLIPAGIALRIVLGVGVVGSGVGFSLPASAAADRSDLDSACALGHTIEQPPDSNVEICCLDNGVCVMCTKGTSDCETFDADVSRPIGKPPRKPPLTVTPPPATKVP